MYLNPFELIHCNLSLFIDYGVIYGKFPSREQLSDHDYWRVQPLVDWILALPLSRFCMCKYCKYVPMQNYVARCQLLLFSDEDFDSVQRRCC